MNEEHPPLGKVLAAPPLVVHGLHADYSSVLWTFSADMRLIFLSCIQNAQQLQPSWDRVTASMQAEMEKRKINSESMRELAAFRVSGSATPVLAGDPLTKEGRSNRSGLEA